MECLGVVGAGVMGAGIAHAAAVAGIRVVLADHKQANVLAAITRIEILLAKGVSRGRLSEAEARGARSKIEPGSMAEAAQADGVVESVVENLEVKQRVLARLAVEASPATWFATNTSSLSITSLSMALPQPERLVGMHFFNPVHSMKLVELVVPERADTQVVEAVRSLASRMEKQVVEVRDSPGFASSRLGICLGMEAVRMVEQGVASAADIDAAMTLGYRHPMGPLRLGDLVGWDVRLAIGEHLAVALSNPSFEPPALLRQMVADGHLGKKSGQGFYLW